MSAADCAYLVANQDPPLDVSFVINLSLLKKEKLNERTNIALAASRIVAQKGTVEELWAASRAEPVIHNPALGDAFLKSIGADTISSPIRKAICWVCPHCAQFSWMPAGPTQAEQELLACVYRHASVSNLSCGINHCLAKNFRNTIAHKSVTCMWNAVDETDVCPVDLKDSSWRGPATIRLHLYNAYALIHKGVKDPQCDYMITSKGQTSSDIAATLIAKTRSVWLDGAFKKGTLSDLKELDIIRTALMCMNNPNVFDFPLDLKYIRDILTSRARSYAPTAYTGMPVSYDPQTGHAMTHDGFDISLFAPVPRGSPVVVLTDNSGAAYVQLAVSCLADVVDTLMPNSATPHVTNDAVLDGPFNWSTFRTEAASTASLIDADDMVGRVRSRTAMQRSWGNLRASGRAYFENASAKNGASQCSLLNPQIDSARMRQDHREQMQWLSSVPVDLRADRRTLLNDMATCDADQTQFIVVPLNTLGSWVPTDVASIVRAWEAYAKQHDSDVDASTDPEWLSWLANGSVVNDDPYIRRFALIRVLLHALDTPILCRGCPTLRANALAFVVGVITPLDRTHLEENLWRLRLSQLAEYAVSHVGAYSVAVRAACGIGDNRMSCTNPELNVHFKDLAYSLREVFRPQITFVRSYIDYRCVYFGTAPTKAVAAALTPLLGENDPRFWVIAYAVNPVAAERDLCAAVSRSASATIASQVAET